MRIISCCFLSLALLCSTPAQQSGNGGTTNPARARLITTDIVTFMRAYDLALKATAREEKVAIFKREYLERGSLGLADFVRLKKIDGPGPIVLSVGAYPRYYASLRDFPQRVAKMEPTIRGAFRRFKSLFQQGRFPDVYFVVGHGKSGGSISENGLLIGADIFGIAPGVPTDEIPEQYRSVFHSTSELPFVISHELIHYQQTWEGKDTLLEVALMEGGADFMAELILPGSPVPQYRTWGDAHESEVWARFARDMKGSDVRNWIGNNARATKDWPAALGYYVGYQIAKAYYMKAPDKKKAIQDLIALKDADAILQQSGYAGKFILVPK